MIGVVKFFLPRLHYGFITISDGAGFERDYFFHGSECFGTPPQKGDTVEFWITDAPKGSKGGKLMAGEVTAG
jgi:cold shock CspA family protein